MILPPLLRTCQKKHRHQRAVRLTYTVYRSHMHANEMMVVYNKRKDYLVICITYTLACRIQVPMQVVEDALHGTIPSQEAKLSTQKRGGPKK
jgi:hypothetical protein